MSDLTWTPVRVRLGQIKPWTQNPRNVAVFGHGIISVDVLNKYPRTALTVGDATKRRRLDMKSVPQKGREIYLACIDCGTQKMTPKAKKAARCHVCENKRRATPFIEGKKTCRVCQNKKTPSEFAFLSRICKKCQSLQSSKWNKANRERKNANNKAYRLRNLEKVKASDRKYYQSNREKYIESNRAYYVAHKEELAQYKRKWLSENPDKKTVQSHRRRALKLSVENTLTAQEWRDVKDSYFNRCVYCGIPATEQDHLIPFFRGGANTADNVVPACKTCNSKKGKKPLLLFLYYLMKNGG